MTDLTEKQIVDKAWFLIRDAERGRSTNSFLAPWHTENACVLRELLAAYVSLNTLEQEALRQTGMPLAELLNVSLERAKEPEVFRAKNCRMGG